MLDISAEHEILSSRMCLYCTNDGDNVDESKLFTSIDILAMNFDDEESENNIPLTIYGFLSMAMCCFCQETRCLTLRTFLSVFKSCSEVDVSLLKLVVINTIEKCFRILFIDRSSSQLFYKSTRALF